MRTNIVLTGMMGSGKSTVGRILAERLGLELVDTDREIERWEHCSIQEIFAREGEAYFREKEREIAAELGVRQSLVIACGGGLPLRPDCIRPLKQSSLVFFLRRDPGETYDSISLEDRPLAQDGREAFVARFRDREPVYQKWADYTIEARSAMDAAEQIMAIYIKEGKRWSSSSSTAPI